MRSSLRPLLLKESSFLLAATWLGSLMSPLLFKEVVPQGIRLGLPLSHFLHRKNPFLPHYPPLNPILPKEIGPQSNLVGTFNTLSLGTTLLNIPNPLLPP